MKTNKAKKLTSLFLASLMATTLLGTVACSKKTSDDENTGEVSIFNGGWGIDWMKEVEGETDNEQK